MEKNLPTQNKNLADQSERPFSGLERSFAILNLIADLPRRIIEIKREMDLPWATAHRTVKKLEKAEFLVFNSEKIG